MQARAFLRPRTNIVSEAAVLTVICTWEALALTTGVVPTVTSLTMRLPRPARTALVAATTAWLVTHFELRRPRVVVTIEGHTPNERGIG